MSPTRGTREVRGGAVLGWESSVPIRGALGPAFAVSVDPDDGTLAWRSDGVPISAVVTATSSPVLVEYDPPATSGEDVPFLGVAGTTGRVQLCGIVLAAGVTPRGQPSAG